MRKTNIEEEDHWIRILDEGEDRKMVGGSSSRSRSAGGLWQELRRTRARLKTKRKLGFGKYNVWIIG